MDEREGAGRHYGHTHEHGSDQEFGRGFEIGFEGRGAVHLVYVLYLIGFGFPVAALIGLIMAYLSYGKYGATCDTHFDFQIYTFWIGLAMVIVGGLLSIILIGGLVFILWVVWTVVRVITGIQRASAGYALREPKTLGFRAV